MKQLTQQQLEQVYREHPEWRTEIEVGKWYHYESYLLCYTGADDKLMRAYGFDEDMQWVEENIFWLCPEKWNQAHPEEVSSALIAEARKRGFKSNQIKMIGDTLVIGVGDKWKVIFIDGKWADVREVATTVEVGKWYKNPMAENLFCPTSEVKDGHVSAFGFTGSGARWWSDDGKYEWCVLDVVEATHEEVEAELIAEAKRRYRDGDKVDRFAGLYLGESNSMVIQMVDDSFMELDGSVWVKSDNGFSICLFTDGKWATVITPASTLAEDIQALKDKYPNYNWTIIAEEKQ